MPYVRVNSNLPINFQYFSIQEYEISFLDKNKRREKYQLHFPNNRKKQILVETFGKTSGKQVIKDTANYTQDLFLCLLTGILNCQQLLCSWGSLGQRGLKELRLFHKQRVCSALDTDSGQGKDVPGWCRHIRQNCLAYSLPALRRHLGLQVFGCGCGCFLHCNLGVRGPEDLGSSRNLSGSSSLPGWCPGGSRACIIPLLQACESTVFVRAQSLLGSYQTEGLAPVALHDRGYCKFCDSPSNTFLLLQPRPSQGD